jgi:hypothetical protein
LARTKVSSSGMGEYTPGYTTQARSQLLYISPATVVGRDVVQYILILKGV